MKLAIGLMSGTSGDGVSLALASFQDRTIKVLAHHTFPYPFSLQKFLHGAADLKTPQISKLNVLLGNYFADCTLKFLKKCRRRPSEIAGIGSHGHTIYHGGAEKPRHTFQIGEPSILAEKIAIPVVADFRMRDIAAGGQGAPLISFFDEFFFGNGPLRALQNIGGIGNVSLVGKSVKKVKAFDTGPGNCLIDWAVQKITKGKSLYDRGGKIAARGWVDPKAIRQMAAHPYFSRNPPKSTGRELFNERFVLKSLLKESPENLVATLTYFTAFTIHESYRRFLPKKIAEIIVSGGGALNRTLMGFLKKLFAPMAVRTIEAYGIPVQAKEPAAFAFFALRALEGKINHAPSGSGANHACILGKIIR